MQTLLSNRTLLTNAAITVLISPLLSDQFNFFFGALGTLTAQSSFSAFPAAI
jgi:hypothetical protein